MRRTQRLLYLTAFLFTFFIACKQSSPTREVPHEGRWGIYALDLGTEDVRLIYSSDATLSVLRLNPAGDKLAFSMKVGGDDQNTEEIFTLDVDGQNLRQVTHNAYWDLFPAWSPDGARLAFLSWRENDLDIYSIDITGENEVFIYDSGDHDADIDWHLDTIVFTSNHRIWQMAPDGTNVRQITEPPKAGEWETANLPYGDYDPHLSPDGTRVVFERMVDASTTHGSYDIFTINVDGSEETRLTNNGYSQGLPIWSNSGATIVYIVAAIDGEGKYDIYLMNSDGTNNRNVTPDYFPPGFLCHSAVISPDDSQIYFIGEWYQ
jgi:Tol biopolymer transport system component